MKGEIRECISLVDFVKMYRIFEEPPYNEKWSMEEMTQEYEELDALGHVCGYYIDNVCVGLITFRKMIPDQHPVNYGKEKKVVYISDMTVIRELRGNGIGSIMMQYALLTSSKEGYNVGYMRTLQKGESMSYGLAVRLGFTPISDIIQSVQQERNADEREIVDNRIFLDIKLC